MTALRILHLYPRELGINGDAGNVLALRVRAEVRGLDVEVATHHPGDTLPRDVDIVHIGSGPLSGQRAVLADLASIAPALREWKAADVPFLAVAGGWQLLGRSLTTASGEHLEGAGVFESSATLGASRIVGEVVLDSPRGLVAGFENHSATTTSAAIPLGTVIAGPRENGSADGLLDGASIATSLHGPFLPMNPVWADALLLAGLRRSRDIDELPVSERLAAIDSDAYGSRRAVGARLNIGSERFRDR